ncbi:MAG: AMP-binding protein, partial [Victivallales bacterium]|nr:AMP-binding protein [Victivallales bacterium]
IAKPSLDLYSLYFAAMKLGAVPIVLPQWRGWSYALTCVMQSAPTAFIGTPSTFFSKVFFGRAFGTVDVNIMIGRFQLFGGIPVRKLKCKQEEYPIYDFGENDTEVLLFTAGSTGDPKGVALTSKMMEQRLKTMEELFPKQSTNADLSCILPCTLMELCLGRTVIAEDEDMQSILDTTISTQAEYAFAYTNTWYKLVDCCRQQNRRLLGLKKAVILGPPAISTLCRALASYALASEASAMQAYSLAESGFVSAINGEDMLELCRQKENMGKGLPIATGTANAKLKIVDAQNGIGEIFTDTATGDLGCMDENGTIWYCGRKASTLETAAGETLYPACCEEIANAFPGVRRSLLVGVGDKPNQIPVLIVEPEPSEYEKLADNKESLLRHIAAFPQTAGIRFLLFKHEITEDIRQNTQWAAARI